MLASFQLPGLRPAPPLSLGTVRPVTPKTWVLRRAADPSISEALAAELGVSPSFARLLAIRGFTSAREVNDFVEPSIDRLLDAFTMRDMDLAVARIWKAIEAG